MAESTLPSSYKAFACGSDCHFDRYTSFSTRTWFGLKRWGIHDNHMGVNLNRTCTSRLAVEQWRVSLALMELREREYSALRSEEQQRSRR